MFGSYDPAFRFLGTDAAVAQRSLARTYQQKANLCKSDSGGACRRYGNRPGGMVRPAAA